MAETYTLSEIRGMTPSGETFSLADVVTMTKKQPTSVTAGQALNDIPRQLGLTARYGLESVANMAQIVTEPARALTDRLFGQTGKTVPLGALATQAANYIGLPKPADANERVIADATRMGFGALGGVRAAQSLGGVASDALQFVGKNAPAAIQSTGQRVAQFLGMNPTQQVASAVAAGGAGGASREAGGGAGAQALSSLVGGVAGGVATQKVGDLAQSAVNGARNLMPGQQQLFQQRLDQRINITLQNQGIDPATITPAMRSSLREQVGRALQTGDDLNGEAVARLADYTRLGLTPTRARVTLDPYDVTTEQNASRLAAASGSRDARLPQIAQDNNRRLVELVDELGGSRPVDGYGQGNAVIGTIRAHDDALNRNVNNLYAQAREMAGGDIPIDRKPFVDNIFGELARSGKLSFAPEGIMGRINEISGGVVRANGQEFAVPFTAQTIDELKTMVATAQRSTNDGNVSAALSAIRRALDATDVNPVKNNFGGGQVVTGSGAQFLRQQDAQPEQFMDALNQARAAAAQRFNWRESAAPIEQALNGANADRFIKNNVISASAGFDDVQRTAEVLRGNPAALDAVRTAIVQHLKDASIGKGGTSQTANFSGKGMEAALKELGDRKLALFFSPEEVQTLRAMARTGAFETFQPRGSAVNNSNSGAAIGAMLMSLADRVRPVVNRIPGAGPVVDWAVINPLENIGVWAAQRPALNIPQGLLNPRPVPPVGSGLLLPAAAAGGTAAGLLATP